MKSDSAKGRILIWKVSVEMVKDNFITGIWPNTFPVRYLDYQAAYFFNRKNLKYEERLADNNRFMFNEFFLVLAELGIIGFLFLGIFVYLITKTALSFLRLGSSESIVIAAYASLISIAVCALFSYPFQSLPVVITFTFLISLISVYAHPVTIKFRVPLLALKGCFLGMFFLFCLFFSNELQVIGAQKDWKKADCYNQVGLQGNALKVYQHVYPILKSDGYFLCNYGIALYSMHEYEKCVEILTEAKRYFNDSNLYVYIGKAYEALGNNTSAEASYSYASFMVPGLYYPKYSLVCLYQKTGQNAKAIKVAQEIMQMGIKIDSYTVFQIRQDMKNFLKQNSK
jgi:tetratricopeptide (TPR) repeat protein